MAKEEGTLIIEGLVSGPLPDLPDGEERLREWVAKATEVGLDFNLEIDLNSFSILGSGHPLSAEKIGSEPAEVIAELLGELANGFPIRGDAPMVSTLRSVEYRSKEEVQTIYLIQPDGKINVRQRSVEAHTTPPPKPLTRRELIGATAIGLVALILIVGISSFFVDYGTLWKRMVSRVSAMKADDITVKVDDILNGYIEITEKKTVSGHRMMQITLKRGVSFPKGRAALFDALEHAASPKRALALQSLIKGYLHLELFNSKDECKDTRTIRIKRLYTADKLAITFSIPLKLEATRICLTL